MDARALNALRAAKSARAALKIPVGQQVVEGSERDGGSKVD